MVRRTRSSRGEFREEASLRSWTVLAQDPSVSGNGGSALTTQVQVANERLEAGPKGHRVHVIDYDAATNTYYRPRHTKLHSDPYAKVTDIERLLRDPRFHQQNVYAIAMATLFEFERALGRTVRWGFASPGHQLKIAPHAFADANAYYSRDSESLAFGYFRPQPGRVAFTCLSHDIVVHETTHAILDGLRSFFMRPSSPDQPAFHEAFADIVALMSVFKSAELIEHSLAGVTERGMLVPSRALSWKALANNVLMKVADELGEYINGIRGKPLRHSVVLKPSPALGAHDDIREPHKRGEILVAVIMNAFLDVWGRRLDPLGRQRRIALNRTVVAEEGATAARHLLRVVIRALDYLEPVDMSFSSYLSALLTADAQAFPDDTRYGYRDALKHWFGRYGITPPESAHKDGTWEAPPNASGLHYEGAHLEQIQRDPDAVFRFIWENRDALEIDPDAFTRVISVRPCVRVSSEGITLRETVAEYVQTLKVFPGELKAFDIRKPDGLSNRKIVTLYGGGSLVFDEFGRLKYHIGTGVRSARQTGRLQHLYDAGYFHDAEPSSANFSQLHRSRMQRQAPFPDEQW